MKGFNAKKIAALAAGAVFLGSTVASAALVSDLAPSTILVNDNGVPQVSVLVPEAGQPSDGVAGARIASKIAYEAYTTETVTAALSGTPACSASGVNGSTSTCAVEGQTVTLTIESPGVAGLYEMNPLIYEVFDEELNDREQLTDIYDGDENEDDASPYFLNAGDSDTLYRIGSDFDPFEDYSFSVSSMDITETQSAWIDGQTNYELDGEPTTDIDELIYSAKFWWGDDLGIPVCTEEVSDYWGDCEWGTADTSKQVDNKQVYIEILGDKWVISDFGSDPGDTFLTDDEDTRIRGGKITLAKEAVPAQVMHQGDTLEIADISIRLDDITLPTEGTGGGTPNAVVSILDASGTVIDELNVEEGSTEDYEAPDGEEYMIHVYDAVPGLGVSRWARLTVYSHEWELEDNDEIDNDENDDWKVHLYWKNKDAAAAADDADNLREILFVNDDIDDLEEGDSVNMVADPAVYKLTYEGLTTYDMTTLTFEDDVNDDINEYVCAVTNGDSNCKLNSGSDTLWLQVTTSDGEFDGTNDGQEIFIALYDGTDEADCTLTVDAGDIWVMDSDENALKEEQDGPSAGDVDFVYKKAGSNGNLAIDTSDANDDADATDFTADAVAGDDSIKFTITEDIGDVEGAEATATMTFYYGFDDDDDGPTFLRDTAEEQANEVDYVQTGFTSLDDITGTNGEFEDGGVTLRGTELDLSTSQYSFDIPTGIRHMQFTFTNVDDDMDPDSVTKTYVEGDSETFNDVTITVDSIDPDTADCSVSGTGAAGCSYVDGSATAVIESTGTPTLDAMVKGAEPTWGSLVKLDTDAMGITGNFIAVAGPAVNTVTANELEEADVTALETNKVLVKEIAPTKVVVAGWTAEDTLTAADQFIASLKRQ